MLIVEVIKNNRVVGYVGENQQPKIEVDMQNARIFESEEQFQKLKQKPARMTNLIGWDKTSFKFLVVNKEISRIVT